MKENERSLKDMQELVEEMIREYKLEMQPELRHIDLVSEVGELGKELLKSTEYGTKDFLKTDNMELEVGDVLFLIISIANSLKINLEHALIRSINKYEKRFNQKGHIGSED